LQEKYIPIENDANLPTSEKAKHMEDWARLSDELFISNGLTKSAVRNSTFKSIQSTNAKLRDKVVEFFELLNSNRIPLLIFSAGIADVLETVLEFTLPSPLFNSVFNRLAFVVSNRFIYSEEPIPRLEGEDEEDDYQLIGFSTPSIHVFNKKASSFLETPFFQLTDESDRDNVILIGDSLGDLLMSEGLKFNPSNILKVGFLNVNIEERMQQYLDAYDIVIAGEESSFQIPMEILASICSFK